MRIDRILEERRPVFSFEFFPPKTDEGERNLEAALHDLKEDQPDYVSVTYGAAAPRASARSRSTKWIKEDLGLEAMAHLTCVGSRPSTSCARSSTRSARPRHRERARPARRPSARGDGVEAAARGRLPLLHRAHRPDRRANYELLHRRRLLPGGAPRGARASSRPTVPQGEGRRGREVPDHPALLRQRALLRLRRAAREAGIDRADHPGDHADHELRPDQAHHRACAARSRRSCRRELDERADDSEAVAELGVAYATLQCSDLLARGAPGIHFYTLNKSPATRAILAALRAAQPWTRAKAPV